MPKIGNKYLLVAFGLYLAIAGFTLAQTIDVTILHTNDQHGHLLAHDIPGQKLIGGVAPRMTLIEEVRQELATRNGSLLLLDGGDLNTGDPLSDLFQAEPDVKAMNLMRYHAMTVGNHEFDLPLELMLKQKQLAAFPYLSANIFDKTSGVLLFTPLVMFELQGLKIAAFGITTSDTPDLSTCGSNPNVVFRKPEETIPQVLDLIRGKADFIIAMIHAEHPWVVELAKKFPEIDLIIGGHTHLPMPEALKVGKTLIVEAGCYGQMIGRWDLKFTNHKLSDYKYQLIGINLTLPIVDDQNVITCPVFPKKFAPHPEVEELLKPYLAKTEKLFNTVIAEATDDLAKEKRGPFPKSSALGNLIADVMRDVTNADVALQNVGGIRSDLLKGPITYASISRILPFANTIVTAQVTGKQIVELLTVLAQKDPNSGGFFETSGMTFRIKNKAATDITIAGKPLDLAKQYKLATNSFIAKGGDGYKIFDTFTKVDTGFLLSKVVVEYVQKHTPIQPNMEPRMMWVP